MKETYEYDREFQGAILATMVRETQCLPSYRDVIDPRYFEDTDHRTLATEIIDYYEKFTVPPTWSALRAAIFDRCAKLNVDSERLLGVLVAVEKADFVAPQFVMERLLRFGKRQALATSINQIIDLLQKDEGYDKARAVLDKALSVGAARSDALELFAGVNKLESLVKASSYAGERIPTGIPSLDEALGGGVGGPQLGIIQAPPKTGKSTVLVNFGVAALEHLAKLQRAAPPHPSGLQMGVLHISFELYEEDLLVMYLARLLHMTRDEITTKYPQVYDRWPIVAATLAPNLLRIKYFKPWSITVQDLRDYLSRLRATQNWMPRMLVLDYADRMKLMVEDTYRGYGQLYDELIGLGADFRYNTWSATQSNRTGYRAEKSQASQTSDSWLKVANSDIWIPLSQTDVERAAGMMRLNVEFLRRGQDGFEIPTQVDYARAHIRQVGPPVRS